METSEAAGAVGVIRWCFEQIWYITDYMLSFELDFGDLKFTLWQWELGSLVLFIVIILIRGILTRGDGD